MTASRSWLRTLLLTCLPLPALALAAACAPPDEVGGGAAADSAARSAADQPADSAHLLAHRLMEWQGGEETWERTRYLAFDWIVERDGEQVARRSHAWDRHRGDYRLTYTRGDGSRFYALFQVPSMKGDTLEPVGDVWVDGERLAGTARDSALRDAYAAFINDSYWLLMPLKWEDPGVHLAYEGMTEISPDSTFATIHLTFEPDLGVTNDEYWGFLEPETGRMAAWRFHLQGQEQKGPVIWWREWRSFGPQGIRFALDRRWSEGNTRIHFEEVTADTAPPADVFTPPGG